MDTEISTAAMRMSSRRKKRSRGEKGAGKRKEPEEKRTMKSKEVNVVQEARRLFRNIIFSLDVTPSNSEFYFRIFGSHRIQTSNVKSIRDVCFTVYIVINFVISGRIIVL